MGDKEDKRTPSQVLADMLHPLPSILVFGGAAVAALSLQQLAFGGGGGGGGGGVASLARALSGGPALMRRDAWRALALSAATVAAGAYAMATLPRAAEVCERTCLSCGLVFHSGGLARQHFEREGHARFRFERENCYVYETLS